MRLASAVLAFVVSTVALGFAAPEASASGPCPDARGVTVVVDFGAFGGGVEVACAPGDPGSGYDALVAAGFAVEGAVRSPSFLCRIDGLPTAATDACVVPPPATAYWSYWVADRGRSWCYSNVGMYGRDPQPGTVEGWSFVRGSGNGATAAPRSGTFGPVAGGGTTGSDCDAATTATTAKPRPNPTTPPTASVPSAPSGGAGARPGPSIGGGVTTVAPSTTRPATPDTTSTTAVVAGETTIVTSAPSTTAPAVTTGDESTEADDEQDADADKGDRDETARSDAVSTVALADSGRSGPGGPWGTAVAAGVVAALGAGAFIVNRRRLRVAPQPAEPVD